jgi:hypothetical protein
LTETSSNSGIALIKSKAVTNSKLADLSGSSQLKGSASTAPDATDITLGVGFSMNAAVLNYSAKDAAQIISRVDQDVTASGTLLTFGTTEFVKGPSITPNTSHLGIIGPGDYRATFFCTSITPNPLTSGASATFALYNRTYTSNINDIKCQITYDTTYNLYGNLCFVTIFHADFDGSIAIRLRATTDPTVTWTIKGASFMLERLY